MTATVESATTDTDIAYAVGTAANAWGDTDYWVDETGETISLKRSTVNGGQALRLHVCDDVVSWGLLGVRCRRIHHRPRGTFRPY